MARKQATTSDDRLRLADRLALRPAEAAKALGVSERTLRQLLPELPHLRAGGCVMIPIDGLRQWLLEQAQAGKSRVDAAVEDVLASISSE
jgi:excisionase family DNA binding protein